MKRFTQFICLLLVISTIMIIPAYAVEEVTPRGSNYFASRLAYLYKTTSTQFQVWIEVTSMSTMDELGASSITVQRSSDNSNWTDMKTYTKESYTQLIGKNTANHEAYVTYTGTSGYYYRAKIWFYAKNSSGTAEYSYTTASIQL